MVAAKAAPRAAVIRSPPGARAPRATRHARTSARRNTSSVRVTAKLRKGKANDTLSLERSFCRRLPSEEGGSRARFGPQGRDQDVVAPLDNPAAIRRHHVRRL